MSNNENQNKATNYPALYILISVFFFWGFIAASNGVFIPFCKSKFELNQFQSQLIDSAFYFAYYLGAFLLFIISVVKNKDLLNSWGFKNGIVYGLIISVIGAFLMVPALQSGSYAFILSALFVIALGFSLQQTAAQPFAISLGDEKTGAARLNLAGGINSFGTMIGPIIFALALFGTTKMEESMIKSLSLSTVEYLYVLVGVAFLIAAIVFRMAKKLPSGKNESSIENESKATSLLSTITLILIVVLGIIFYQYTNNYNTYENTNSDSHLSLYLLLAGIAALVIGLLIALNSAKKKPEGWGALKFPQLVLGMLGIFTYVGVEVAIQSNLGEYLKNMDYLNFLGSNPGTSRKNFDTLLENNQASGFWNSLTPALVSLYWGSLMIGRWTGAVTAFNISSKSRKMAMIILPYIAFIVILGTNFISNLSEDNPMEIITMLLPYAGVILIQIIGFYLGQEKPAKTLTIFGILGMVALIIGMNSTGWVAVFSLISGGLFCSVMWPCVFSLSTQGLGKYTSQGSAFLIMMILGGAFIPPLQGKIADMIGINESYWVSVLCFAYLAFFGYWVVGILKKQGIDVNQLELD